MVPLGAEGVLLVAFAPVGRGLRFYLSPRSWVTGRNAGAQRRYRRACAAAAPLLPTGFRQSRLGRSPWPWCCLSRVSGCGLPWFCELVSLLPHVPLCPCVQPLAPWRRPVPSRCPLALVARCARRAAGCLQPVGASWSSLVFHWPLLVLVPARRSRPGVRSPLTPPGGSQGAQCPGDTRSAVR